MQRFSREQNKQPQLRVNTTSLSTSKPGFKSQRALTPDESLVASIQKLLSICREISLHTQTLGISPSLNRMQDVREDWSFCHPKVEATELSAVSKLVVAIQYDKVKQGMTITTRICTCGPSSILAMKFNTLHFNGHFPGEPGLAGVY